VAVLRRIGQGSLILLAVAMAAVPAPRALAEMPTRPFSGEDLFALQLASDPQIRPDGSLVAYVRGSNDIMTDRMRSAIWLVDSKTGRETPIPTPGGTATQPRWSPDGQRLAYLFKPDGGKAQIMVRHMRDGATATITAVNSAPGAISWSPDGRRIAFVMAIPEAAPTLGHAPTNRPEGAIWAPPLEVITALPYRRDETGYLKPGHDHIFVVPSSGGEPRQLSDGACSDAGPLVWAPDGKTIFFSALRSAECDREPINTEIYALNVATSTIEALTDRHGPDASPAISPDGKHIAYVGYDDRGLSYHSNQLYLMDRDGRNKRVIAVPIDRRIVNPQWAKDGRSLYIQYDEHGTARVARVTLDGKLHDMAFGLVGSYLDRPYGGIGAYSLAQDGTVAFTSGTALSPADISVSGNGVGRRLTRLNEPLLSARTLGQVAPLAVKAPDGQATDAWIVTPPGFDPARKYPLILEIHGGPFAAYGPTFAVDIQLYAAAGYIVVYANPRGSISYGEGFSNSIHQAYPGKDYDDLMAAVDAAIARGSVDTDNLFVTGGSGGGALAAWIVGKTDRFRAAAAQKPVINWTSMTLTTDRAVAFTRYWFGKMPWEDPQGYWARSPLSLVGQVKTPTMILVGTSDYRTPISESEQYYTALQLRGVPTALVKVPDASHDGVADRPSQLAAKASAILTWFDRYRTRRPLP
jgi:dipeptidyl aminopeptidase/acylaminoacyl peptidase